MSKINELQLAKELIKFPSITPVDAGVMKYLEKKLKELGFKTKILEFKEKGFQPVKNLYARLGTKQPNLYCVVIIKTVDEKTRSKTSLNDLLRD